MSVFSNYFFLTYSSYVFYSFLRVEGVLGTQVCKTDLDLNIQISITEGTLLKRAPLKKLVGFVID